jgi:inner membrane protein
MPSPIGHMLAGAAAGLLVSGRRDASAVPVIVFALVAAAPDLDLLSGSVVHRGPSHSLAAAVLAGVAAWVLLARRDGRVQAAVAVAAAYATHTVADWLSADTTPPMGLMALWPLTNDYYVAPVPIFLAVSRRYWLAETWLLNLRAVIRELLILGPLLWIAWWVTRPRR